MNLNLLMKWFQKGLKADFLLNIRKLMIANMISQLIALCSTPIITRIYSPEDFGTFGLYLSITTVFSVIITLRYEGTIVIAKSEGEAKSLFIFCLIIVIFMSFLSIVVLFFMFCLFSSTSIFKQLGYSIYLLPLTFLVAGFVRIFNEWRNRKKQYTIMAVSSVSRAFSSTTGKMGLPFLAKPSSFLIILGELIGLVFECLFLISTSFYQIRDISFKSVKKIFKKYKSNFKEHLIQYSDFPKYSLTSNFLNSISLQLPIFLLFLFFASKVVGNYFLSFSILSIPTMFVGVSISQVFYQKASCIDEKKLSFIVEYLFLSLFLIGIPLITFLGVFGEEIFTLIFGAKWIGAGTYSLLLFPLVVVKFCASPISSLIVIKRRQKVSVYFNIIHVINRSIMICLGGLLFKSVIIALFLYSISSTILELIITFYYFQLSCARKKFLFYQIFYLFSIFLILITFKEIISS